MYRGWKSAGCRGWPVPKRGFGYGSIITSAQVKRQGADADGSIVNSIDNNNTECNSEVMRKELKLSPSFKRDFAFAVMIDGIVIALCHSYSSAIILALKYQGELPRRSVEVMMVSCKFGQVFIE